ncbi:phosphonate degradation HD-domain oxygenase [Blastopirellula marina]|uniref:Metal-dependent phosphohydrolase n=1 Tax=Blastopirellula marina TaxID=124 RepID=A0A2S8F962_9BACT|nr:phosphonate degradation HD-domain oxygenase [Blastopirellula marina]PQO28670.1 metal-dependent phosphohydrolase [Blastopirellula marina]PTL41943.1 metal-dependent phosphohydrolase [Blastopirellula marina]
MGTLDQPSESASTDIVADILRLFRERGDSAYGFEAVSQLEHALQAGTLAIEANASSELISAALLHDIGHLLHELPDDAPDQGIDDHHENSGFHFLKTHFGPATYEPVRLHVAAKRYLCAVKSEYHDLLSEPSQTSLRLQGGPMSAEEVAQFESNPFYQAAVDLRYWDDIAKDPEMKTPPLEAFEVHLRQAALA